MTASASNLAHSLSRHAEAVCRHYLSNGRRSGGYWIVGDVRNAPGSLDLRAPEERRSWQRRRRQVVRRRDRRTRRSPRRHPRDARAHPLPRRRRRGAPLSQSAAAGAGEIHQPAQMRLHEHRLPQSACSRCADRSTGRLRKHISGVAASLHSAVRIPSVSTPPASTARTRTRRSRSGRHSLPPSPTCRTGSPASIGLGSTLSSAVADHGKAPIENPRRSLGDIWTHAVRFGVAQDVMAAGEGIETILSLRSVLPALPMIAALSASNLAAVVFPRPLAPTLRRHGRRSRRRARGGSACRPSRRGRDRGHRSSPGEERLQR